MNQHAYKKAHPANSQFFIESRSDYRGLRHHGLSA